MRGSASSVQEGPCRPVVPVERERRRLVSVHRREGRRYPGHPGQPGFGERAPGDPAGDIALRLRARRLKRVGQVRVQLRQRSAAGGPHPLARPVLIPEGPVDGFPERLLRLVLAPRPGSFFGRGHLRLFIRGRRRGLFPGEAVPVGGHLAGLPDDPVGDRAVRVWPELDQVSVGRRIVVRPRVEVMPLVRARRAVRTR